MQVPFNAFALSRNRRVPGSIKDSVQVAVDTCSVRVKDKFGSKNSPVQVAVDNRKCSRKDASGSKKNPVKVAIDTCSSDVQEASAICHHSPSKISTTKNTGEAIINTKRALIGSEQYAERRFDERDI